MFYRLGKAQVFLMLCIAVHPWLQDTDLADTGCTFRQALLDHPHADMLFSWFLHFVICSVRVWTRDVSARRVTCTGWLACLLGAVQGGARILCRRVEEFLLEVRDESVVW